ncbi:MAG: SAM-dependent methyltransferase [Verrucomicrobia bacterium]|nr:SAM-dependent methyltransferase [Verrucomicrobiota bacterium]
MLPAVSVPPARARFLSLVDAALRNGSLVKLTLGKPSPTAADATLRNVFVRPVALRDGPHLSFVWRHETRDLTRNHRAEAAAEVIAALLGSEFLDGHLFTPTQTAQVELSADGPGRLRIKAASGVPLPRAPDHDRSKPRIVPSDAPWLRGLGVTRDDGRPREGMAPKLRQIERFAETLQHLLKEAGLPSSSAEPAPAVPFHVVDMGCGKGYLTFATSTLLGRQAVVTGVEARPDLVAASTEWATRSGLTSLRFVAGQIADTPLEPPPAVLIALHACNTATDDALARAIAAGARLIIVSPCCHQELRPRLVAPPVLAPALAHGIFREREAEFVTDALRALLLEWAGYRTKVFEFISTEHTPKNVMIAAIRTRPAGDEDRRREIEAFAAFYGIREQALARHLGLALATPGAA